MVGRIGQRKRGYEKDLVFCSQCLSLLHVLEKFVQGPSF